MTISGKYLIQHETYNIKSIRHPIAISQLPRITLIQIIHSILYEYDIIKTFLMQNYFMYYQQMRMILLRIS
jgi:hypothetical protein